MVVADDRPTAGDDRESFAVVLESDEDVGDIGGDVVVGGVPGLLFHVVATDCGVLNNNINYIYNHKICNTLLLIL